MKDKACKICRRENEKLLLKAERCYSAKCAMIKRPYAPGQHGQNFRGKQSEYGRQLREKQKIKAIYGIMETQLSNYYKEASKKEGSTIENFISSLELRLDNILYRSGLFPSRRSARQAASYGKVMINSKKVTIPSIILKEKDEVQVTGVKDDAKLSGKLPSWISLDIKKKVITINRIPLLEEIDLAANEKLVAEFYSR